MRTELGSLTSLRFFAALAIVVHHCNGVFWPAKNLGPLDAGVSFFFVLSGFILTYAHSGMPAGAASRWAFYRARLVRIFPLHLLTLALTMVLVDVPEPFDARVLAANALLLHAWIPLDRYFFSYNYVSWSISTELFFYLLFPFLLHTGRARLRACFFGTLLLVAALAVASYLGHLPSWQTTHDHLSATGLLYTNPLARLAEFVLGMLAARVYLRRCQAAPVIAGSAPWSLRWTLAELAAVLMFGLAYAYLLSSFAPVIHQAMLSAGATTIGLAGAAEEMARLSALSPAAAMVVDEWANHVGMTPFAVLLIYVFARQRGVLSRLLSLTLLRRLGEISFALYLVHQIVLRLFQQHGASAGALNFSLYLLLCLLSATALFHLVEQPARRFLRRARLPHNASGKIAA
ncbi:MAG: acyltransferase family protein [Janthinobacterium lividum]